MNVDITVLENYMCSAVWSPHLCAVKRGGWVLDMYSIVLVCNKWDGGGGGGGGRAQFTMMYGKRSVKRP